MITFDSWSSLVCVGLPQWAGLLSVAVHRLFLAAASLLQSMGPRDRGFSVAVVSRLELLLGVWSLPGPNIEPVSAALAGGFLSHAPPGKSSVLILLVFWSLPSWNILFLVLQKHFPNFLPLSITSFFLEIFFFLVLQKDFSNFLPASVATPSWDILYLSIFLTWNIRHVIKTPQKGGQAHRKSEWKLMEISDT